MLVKYKINSNTFFSGTSVDNTGQFSALTVNIPIFLSSYPVDQSELVQRDFVNTEVENAINPIIDFEKVRFTPVVNYSASTYINYNLVLSAASITSNITTTTYSDLGFTDEDKLYQRNNIKKSFLQLSFYDTSATTTQNLIAQLVLYPNIFNMSATTNQIYAKFELSNPTLNPSGFGEGYYIYYYSDMVDLPKELYMSAEFNNAKFGSTLKLTATSGQTYITNYAEKLYTKYILKRVNDGYFYELDATSGNVFFDANNIFVNLFELVVI